MSESDIKWTVLHTDLGALALRWRCVVDHGTPDTGTTKAQLTQSIEKQCATALNSVHQPTGVPPDVWEQAKFKTSSNVSTMLEKMTTKMKFPLTAWTCTVETSARDDGPHLYTEIKIAEQPLTYVVGSANKQDGKRVKVSYEEKDAMKVWRST